MLFAKITAIELGWGEESIYYSTKVEPSSHRYVDEIIKDKERYAEKYETVYRGFKNGKPVFQMMAGNNITLYY